VLFRVTTMPADELAARLRDAGVLVLTFGPDSIRAVTSLMVSRDDMDAAVRAVGDALAPA
jgi:acetylornithine/succinyldiaminopimelate/putrescine aminotransferase